MRKIITILCVMFFLSGCMGPTAPFKPSQGIFYTGIKAPLSTEFHNQKMIKTHGEAKSTYVAYYFLSFSLGDNSLQKAMKDGVLENATYADYEWFSILGVFGRLTVNVYGVEQPERN